jgi:hypothetical protein
MSLIEESHAGRLFQAAWLCLEIRSSLARVPNFRKLVIMSWVT